MSNVLFLPQETSKKWTIKNRRLGIPQSYNFVNRAAFAWQPAGWRLNNKVLGRIHCRLHYLALHAPTPVRKHWKEAYKVFYKKHFGTESGSVRYLNNWSCHKWM